MKRIAIVLTALLFLSGCSNTNDMQSSEKLAIPKDCEATKILEAFPEKVPNARYVPTEWEPAEGTDLWSVYNAGGIACTYGIQEAEVGATVMWAPDENGVFSERAAIWKEDGHKEIDLPGLEEDQAYVLTQGNEGDEEFIVWGVNLLIKGYWIQVNATFFGSVEEAMPIINAAVESLSFPEMEE